MKMQLCMITQPKNEHFFPFPFSPQLQMHKKCEPNASSCGECFHNKLCSIFLLSFLVQMNLFIYLKRKDILLLSLSFSLSTVKMQFYLLILFQRRNRL